MKHKAEQTGGASKERELEKSPHRCYIHCVCVACSSLLVILPETAFQAILLSSAQQGCRLKRLLSSAELSPSGLLPKSTHFGS